MLRQMFSTVCVVNVINSVLAPIAAYKRRKRFVKKFGPLHNPLPIGTLILSEEECRELVQMGALPIIERGRQRWMDATAVGANAPDMEV